jgi:hypothetical protein
MITPIDRLKRYFLSKGCNLQPRGDCFLLTFPSGKETTVNLRWKTKPVWGRIAKRWEWSIPLLVLRRYEEQGINFLVVLETSTGIIYLADREKVSQQARVYQGDDLDNGGTVFLPVDGYKQLGIVYGDGTPGGDC